MGIKLKFWAFFTTICLAGCSSNSNDKDVNDSADFKRFSGVVNNSSVVGADVTLITIGKHGQFVLDEDADVKVSADISDENGRFDFVLNVDEFGPYVLTVSTPVQDDYDAKASCQLALGCVVNGDSILFGDFYSLQGYQQWSAAIESISSGQFVVVNPITEMARVFGFSTYINDTDATETTEGTIAAASYYSNYGVVKGNSQTAALFGLGDILSVEPVNMANLHLLNTDSSSFVEESIRYGALLAAWQKLEMEFNANLTDDDFNFQQEVIKQFVSNGGQLYQASALDNQILSVKKLYQAALINLKSVRDYHLGLARSIPAEVNLVISRFETEIAGLQDGILTTAKPIIFDHYLEDYSDAVMKTKAMVNYIADLQNNFATEEYRKELKASSDLLTAEARRLSPAFDSIFEQILSIYSYYLSCTHNTCDTQSAWHEQGNTFDAKTNILTIVQSADTRLQVSQALVFDAVNPEGSTSGNVHDLFLSGAIEFNGLRLELSDSVNAEGVVGVRNGLRFSFADAVSELPLPPSLIVGGRGASVNENLISDYIELAIPNFKIYDPSQTGLATEIELSGGLTALMIANTDVNDFLEGRAPEDKYGKRYNLSSVRGTLNIAGQRNNSAGASTALRDNAILYIEATASESFVSAADFSAYFPDTVYPTFEAFFKPREGFEAGTTSQYPLVVSRRGVMNFPKLDSEGVASEVETVEVPYLEIDYEIGGLERYVAYPKLEGENQFWGLICSAQSDVEDQLVDPEYTRVIQDANGNEVVQSLLNCSYRDKYSGDATPDNFVRLVHDSSKDFFNLREYNGRGAYRIDYPLTADGMLEPLVEGASYYGVLEKPIVLGVDSMRVQFKSKLVNTLGTDYLPESLVDISLTWRTHEIIDVNALLAFNPEQVVNNPNGSGLPYLAVGSNSESYSIAYRTDEQGNESGEYALAWAGVHFIDGPVDGTKVMQKTDDDDLKEGVFSVVGSNVNYSAYNKRDLERLGVDDGANLSEEKCGFFGRGNEPDKGIDCEAIAYFTFRGLVTGSLREERDGVYVIRYIDGTWQVLGAN